MKETECKGMPPKSGHAGPIWGTAYHPDILSSSFLSHVQGRLSSGTVGKFGKGSRRKRQPGKTREQMLQLLEERSFGETVSCASIGNRRDLFPTAGNPDNNNSGIALSISLV